MSKVNHDCIQTGIYELSLRFISLDQEWLDVVNVERKKEQLNAVSYETFEIVMDRLEKEWFDLVYALKFPTTALNH